MARILSSIDKSVHISAQTVKGAINTNPVFTKARRNSGGAKRKVTYQKANEIKVNRQSNRQVKEAITDSAELSFDVTQDTGKYLDGLLHGVAVDSGVVGNVTIAATATGFESAFVATGTVISYNDEDTVFWDATWDGTFFWGLGTDQSNRYFVYQYTELLGYTGVFFQGTPDTVTLICANTNNLILGDTSALLLTEYDKTGVATGFTIDVSNEIVNSFLGVEYLNGFYWVVDSGYSPGGSTSNSVIFKYDSLGNYTGFSFLTTESIGGGALFAINDNLMQVSRFGNGMAEYTQLGVATGFLQSTGAFADSGITSGVYDGESIWVVNTSPGEFQQTQSAFPAISTGDWFKISGFTDSTIDGFYKAAAAFTGGVTTTTAPAATESAGQAITIEFTKTVNDITPTYYTIQNRITDENFAGSTNYKTFYDANINDGSIDISGDGVITGSLAFNIGAKVVSALAISGQTDGTDDTSSPLSAGNSVTAVYIDGVDSACSVKSFNLAVKNNYTGDRSAACEGEQYAFGGFDLDGSLTTWSTTASPYDWETKYENGDDISLAVLLEWPDGNWMIIDVLSTKLTDHSMPDGKNVILENSMSWAAQEDEATNRTVQIFRSFV